MTPSVDHLVQQAQLAQHHGELDRAEALYSEARAHSLESGEKRAAAMIARSLGVISLLRGDHDQTLRHYRTSLNEFRALGAPTEVLTALSDTGVLCTDLERWDDAVCAFDEAVEIADALGDITARILLEVNRAELEIARRDFAAAPRRVRAGRAAVVADAR
jgi:tetratricopeptide (TPR) repeat protein